MIKFLSSAESGPAHPLRRPGQGRGQWQNGADFDTPLPADVLAGFEGRGA